MTIEKFYNILKSFDIPVAYELFEEAVFLPFILYKMERHNNLKAENKTFKKVRKGYLEIYTKHKDFEIEEEIEKVLEENMVAFYLENTGKVQGEKANLTRYNIEFIES